jgi:hypothetical protein
MHYLLSRVDAMVETSTAQEVVKYYSASGTQKTLPVKKLYPFHPHGTADNHFSGDNVLDFAGRIGFGLTLTTRRDRFANGLKDYMHFEKVDATRAKRSKVMRYENPIVAINKVSAPPESSNKNYTKTHVSFQSTGATNISGVNNLSCVKLYVSRKSRGIGNQKRVWGIEMNEGRATYLNTYFAVDNVDHMIKNCAMRLISWKYWHAPYLHAHAMGVIAAYDMYQQACDGRLDPEWTLSQDERMSFREFRMRLSEQMLQYNPKDGLLPGDENFRVSTKRMMSQRGGKRRRKSGNPAYVDEGVTASNYKVAKLDPRGRLCGDLVQFREHSLSMNRSTNKSRCEVCDQDCRWRCAKCGKYMCVLDNKAYYSGGSCMIRYHCDTFFGLAKSDAEMSGVVWKAANENKVRRHAEFMRKLTEDIARDESDLNTIQITPV